MFPIKAINSNVLHVSCYCKQRNWKHFAATVQFMICFKLGDSHDAMCEMTFTVCGLAALSLPTLQTVMLYTYNTVHICLF